MHLNTASETGGEAELELRSCHTIQRAYTRIVRNELFMGAHYTEKQAWTMPKSRPPGRPRRTAARKTATRKTATRRTAARKTSTRKAATRRTAARKTATRRTAARKTAARRTTVRKTAARKTPARRTAARKTATGKTAARRTPVARKRRTLEISATVLPAAELEPKVTMDEVPQPEQAPPEEGDYQTMSKPEPSA